MSVRTSAPETGKEVETAELARVLLELQALGCHNINLFPPTFVIAQVLQALALAVEGGLHVPLIYNTQGYESCEALHLLDGVVDVFATDMLVGNVREARRYLKLRDYPPVNRLAVKEMHRQVGDLLFSSEGLALRGLLVRHWVLPDQVAGTARVARFLSHQISPDTFLCLLDDYSPAKGTKRSGTLGRRPLPEEIDLARQAARAAGLRRVFPGPLTTIRLEGPGMAVGPSRRT
jgi:putative pyruvate formate lyase activating enzyme